MPYSLRKPCALPGCMELVSHGYCPKHRAVAAHRSSEKELAVHRLYGREWQKRRRLQLAREPWCAECLRANIYTPALDVHHKVRHQGDVELFRNGELESLCHPHHSARTAVEVGINVRGRGGQNV